MRTHDARGLLAGMTSLICFMPFFFLSRTQYYLEEPVIFVGYQLCMVGAGPCSLVFLFLLRCMRRAACTGPPKLMLMTSAGVWWIGFYFITWRRLLPRPAPSNAANSCCTIFSNSVGDFGEQQGASKRRARERGGEKHGWRTDDSFLPLNQWCRFGCWMSFQVFQGLESV